MLLTSDKSRTDVGNEFHAVGSDTQKQCGPYRVSWERGILGYGVNTSESLLTPGRTSARYDAVVRRRHTCWPTYTAWTGCVVAQEANGGCLAWCWLCGWMSACRCMMSHAAAFKTDWSGRKRTSQTPYRGHCCNRPRDWKSRCAPVSSQRR